MGIYLLNFFLGWTLIGYIAAFIWTLSANFLVLTTPTPAILKFPENYIVDEIPLGCYGIAGSFGYEKEHYELSMKVGELVLFPAVRESNVDTIIAAPGNSCRHQIKDGTNRNALHPVEVLFDAFLH